MDATPLSVGVLLLLALLSVVPLILSGVAVRSNSRFSSGSDRRVVFWVLIGVYFAVVLFVAVLLVSDDPTNDQEGYVGLFFGGALTVGTLPGSIIPLLASWAVGMRWIPAPFFFTNMWDWFVCDSVSLQFFFVMGVRWIAQAPQRRAAAATGAERGP